MSQKIKDIAEQAIFYVSAEGLWYRIQYCEEQSFTASDEDTGDDIQVQYDDVNLSKEKFYKLTEMVLDHSEAT